MFKQNVEGLGEYIAKRREEIGYSQCELADKCNISRTEISRIEIGQRKQPAITNLKAISKALYIPYDEILRLAGYLPKDDKHALDFYYPALKTDKQKETIEKIIELISSTPELSDKALDAVVLQAELYSMAAKLKVKM